MVKKLILLLFIVAPLSMVAQDKIAFVNFQEVLLKMPELKDVESKLAAKQEALKKNSETIMTEYQTKLEDYQKKLEVFQKGGSDVTEAILLDKQKELGQLEERYQNFMQQGGAELEKEQQTLFQPIHEKVRKAIKDVGDAQGYSYILDGGSLPYTGSTAIDANKLIKAKLGIVD